MKRPLCLIFLLSALRLFSQQTAPTAASKWVDSVFATLNEDQKIAQLMVMRMSGIDAGKKVVFYEKEVKEAIEKYNIGGICLFQGGPLKQASVINDMQAAARIPLLVSIDGENGLGMRMDSVTSLPRQMMMGAVDDPTLIYQYGRLVGEQCKRIGIQMNYAPVVDVNNNPDNPVINDRSFGEDKFKVALYGMQYMRGLQDVGVMACVKHFPGHGDVNVDSHFDLPVINKTKGQLDSLELYPFRQIINAGVASVMVAHLSIPAIDNTANKASSLSYNIVTGLIRNELGHKGLILTDALEMKGITKYFPAGEAAAQALEAGNDMLCLPIDIPGSIKKIKEAIKKNRFSWGDIDTHVRRVLLAKYQYGLSVRTPVSLDHLTEDLNAKTHDMRRLIAEHSLTLLRNDDAAIYPLVKGKRIAYVGIGINKDNEFARQVRNNYDAHVYYFDNNASDSLIAPMMSLLYKRYDVVIIGVHKYSRFPANGFGISSTSLEFIRQMQLKLRTITLFFGNPYALKNVCSSKLLLACYEDDDITQQTAADLLAGSFVARGKLPVTVCETLKYGQGIVLTRLLPVLRPFDLGFNSAKLMGIDSVITDAIRKRAIPGAVVLVAKDGKIAYERAFGYMGYDSLEPVYPETIYDIASVTKVMATTVSVMKLYDEGKLVLTKTLGDYLPWTRGTNKEKLLIWNILLHQAGLRGWIPFYKETIDTLRSDGASYNFYSSVADSLHSVRVAQNMYMRHDWIDTMYNRILTSSVGPQGVYLYSDLDFIFMGKVVEAITGTPLDQYVKQTFYDPLKMTSTAFRPRNYFPLKNIAPTETETGFRHQMIRGDVHDPGAAMFGGVAGHAGLFSSAYDLAVLCQMLLNGGKLNGVEFFSKGTVDLFTSYHGESRRGLGFDKADKKEVLENMDSSCCAIKPLVAHEPYPTASASPLTFGHTGFTGTCIWVDPTYNLIYIFLSNRVYSNGDAGRFNRLNVRPKVHEIIYNALGVKG
jgi:beta-N-acetylhexosaminidase